MVALPIVLAGRKVRTPSGSGVGNTHPPQGEDQSHRDEQSAQGAEDVKRGNLSAEQDQIDPVGGGQTFPRAAHSHRPDRPGQGG